MRKVAILSPKTIGPVKQMMVDLDQHIFIPVYICKRKHNIFASDTIGQFGY